MLKGALRWAWKQGLVPDNLSPRISLRRETNGREIYLTRAQVKKLALCAPSNAIRNSILIAAYSGLRAQEVTTLAPSALILGPSLRVKGKGDKIRTIPVPKSLLPSLRALPLGLSYWQLHKGFAQARSRAGLGPEVTFHCLRHSFASWLINDGVDLYTVGRLLGHSSTQTTARYAHLVQATLRKAVNRLR